MQPAGVITLCERFGTKMEVQDERPKGFCLGFWTLGSTARLVMHECEVVRSSAVARGRSSAHTANTDKNLYTNSAAPKGTNGVSTNGVTASSMLFDTGTFWVLPLTYFHLPKSARAYRFLQSVETHYFCSGPISVDPVCPQPRAPSRDRKRCLGVVGRCAGRVAGPRSASAPEA